MKAAILFSVLFIFPVASEAQQSAPMTPVVPAQTAPNNNAGQTPPGNPTAPAPGMAIVPTNQFNNTNFNPGVAIPQRDTNELAMTNRPSTNMANPAVSAALALTNRLSTMAPVQAQNVIQVQVQLNVLQQIAVNLGGAQSVQQVVLRNPQTQQQLQQVSTRIIALARGPGRPSVDSVDRLSLDLVRACGRARLGREHQLVLAIIINEACNSQNVTAAQLDETVNNGLIILREAGVQPAFCNSIGCDLHSIAFEVQPSLGI